MSRTFARSFAWIVGAPAIIALSVLGAACIEKETRNVMYLDPGGSVTWSITESNVRSNSEKPDERSSEEEKYRQEMISNPTPLVELLESLGGRSVSRTVLKDTVPFEVHTIATFDGIDVLFERICAVEGILCSSRVSREGKRTTWSIDVTGESEESGTASAMESLEGLRIVLVEGRFVAASGFKIVGERAVTLDDGNGQDEHVVLTLTWEK